MSTELRSCDTDCQMNINNKCKLQFITINEYGACKVFVELLKEWDGKNVKKTEPKTKRSKHKK
jgi:hypothetical protein